MKPLSLCFLLLSVVACSSEPAGVPDATDATGDRWFADGGAPSCGGDGAAASACGCPLTTEFRSGVTPGTYSCQEVGAICEADICGPSCEPWACECITVDGGTGKLWHCYVRPYTP